MAKQFGGFKGDAELNLNNDHSTLMFNANKRCYPPKGESRDFEPFGRVEPLNFQFDALSGCRVSDARRDCKTAVFTGYSNKTNKARRLSSTGFMKDGQVASPHQKTEVEAATETYNGASGFARSQT